VCLNVIDSEEASAHYGLLRHKKKLLELEILV